jgi:hypothetical protein
MQIAFGKLLLTELLFSDLSYAIVEHPMRRL